MLQHHPGQRSISVGARFSARAAIEPTRIAPGCARSTEVHIPDRSGLKLLDYSESGPGLFGVTPLNILTFAGGRFKWSVDQQPIGC